MKQRRWYDQEVPMYPARIFLVLIMLFAVVAGIAAIRESKATKRVYMMEQTINRLTHEVGDCRINRFSSKS